MLYDTKEFNSDDRQGMSAYVSVIYSLLISIIIMFVLYKTERKTHKSLACVM